MSKGQFCVYLSKDQSKQLKSFIYESKIFNKTQLDALFDVLPNNYLEIMMSVLQTTYRRPLDINNSIDKSIIKDYIINKYNELNNKESEDDSSIEYYTTGEVVSNEEVESLRDNGAGVFQSFLGNVNNNLISFRRAVFENARKQGIEITDKKDSDFYKFITSLSDSIIRKLMKEGKIITIRPDENLNTNMAVQVNGDVITITYNPLLVVRDADKFDAIISHELLHTVTAAAVNNTQHNIANEEEQQFTQEIFDIIKDLATNENFYWDMNIDINSMRGKYKYIKEFIANVMSNEELREHLSKLKYQQNNNDIAEEEKTSVLTKVFKSIYNYIKSFYSKDTDKELDTTYLEKLTNIIQSHIDTQPSNSFNSSSNYTQGTIKTPIKEEFKGKLIFAQSGTGKSRVADNINVIDGDYILGDILGVDSDFIGITYNQLSNSDKLLFSKEYHKKIESLVKEGKTVLTASTSLLDKADIIIYNESVSQAINRANSSDRLGSNNINLSEYHTNTLNTIQEYLKGNNVPSIKLSENQYLSDVLLSDPSILQSHKKQTQSNITETCEKFLANFGISVNNLQEYDSNLPLFDALNRVVNVSSEEELSEATGYAVAFMMQWSPEIKELVAILHSPNKSVKRAFKRKQGHVKFTISEKDYKILNKTKYLKEIGKDIAAELNKLHSKQEIKVEDNWLKRIWKVISEFLDIMTPQTKEDLRRISSYTSIIAQAINRNQKNLITPISSKPDTITETLEDLPSQVQVGEALKDNPYEESIIDTLQKEGIYIAGSTSIAAQGSLLRPKENPLHDLDFSAHNKTKEDLDSIINKYYPNNMFIRTISGEEGKVTYTYLVLDRPFESKRTVEDVAVETLFDKNTGKRLGSWVKSDLVLEEGVKGKFLDFFTGPENFKPVTKVINGKKYTFSNAKEALQAKINWQRKKDLWDFNRYIPNKDTYSDQYTEGTITSEYEKELQLILLNSPRDKEGRLLAPNGNPTNLTERQYAQVRTKAFKDWFGDWENDPENASKVVDENGEPLVVYHGGSNTKVFNTKGGQFGAGIKKGDIGTYFTPSEKSARGYEEIYNYKIGEKWLTLKELADNGELSEEDIKSLDEVWENEKPNTRAFFLNIRNPKITNFIGDNTKGFNSEDSNIGDNNDGQFININSSKPKEYVAFSPNQIKSATANVGTFSKTNNRIDQYTEGKVGDASKVITAIKKGKMTFSYGSNKRKEVTSNTTIEAIRKGERTATTRYTSEGNINYWKDLKVGDIVEFQGQNNKDTVLVRITKPLTQLPKDTSAEEWSKKEGWSVEYFNKNVKSRLDEAYQMEFEYVSDSNQSPQNTNDKGTSTKSAKVATTFYTKDTPLNNPNTNYVYTENAQVYTKLNDVKGVDREAIFNNDPKMLKLDVTANNNQAGIRAYTKEGKVVVNTNAYGLVTKKFQQNKEGKFIHQEGVFKDTKEDFELFKALNEDVFNRLENSSNKEVVFPANIAIGKAALPKRFAEWLQNELKTRYGLEYTIVENEQKEKNNSVKYSGYGLQITQPQQSKKTTSNKTGLTKEEKKKKEAEAKKKAKEIYNAPAPNLENLKINKEKLDSILSNKIPNIAVRRALVKSVYNLFNIYWDRLVENAKRDKETTEDEQLKLVYDYIFKGSEEEQKIKLINTLSYSREGKNINAFSHILYSISDIVYNFSQVTREIETTNTRGDVIKDNEVNENAMNAVINFYLLELDKDGNVVYNNGEPVFKRNSPFGEAFYTRFVLNKTYLKQGTDLKSLAVEFTKNISINIRPLQDMETLKAVLMQSQKMLKHYDGIKVNFLNKMTNINADTSNLNEPEEEDRSGLNLIRFKTLEPSKRMSQRVRRELSKLPRYVEGEMIYDALGLPETLTPDAAYFQLVDKFSTIRNEQDYNNLIETLSEELPWFRHIKDKIDEDKIFRNEFYSAFRNTFNRYSIINSEGKISYLNGEASLDLLIEETQDNYESGLQLSKYSIYNTDTTPNMANISKLRDSVLAGVLKGFAKNFGDITKQDKKMIPDTAKLVSLMKQLFVLSDQGLFVNEINLTKILNAIGVNTERLDITHLYTTLQEIQDFINNKIEEKKAENPEIAKELESIDLKALFNKENYKNKDTGEYNSSEQFNNIVETIDNNLGLKEVLLDYFNQDTVKTKINKLISIISGIQVITNKNTGIKSSTSNIIQSYYKQYLKILNPLKGTSEIYGTATFTFDNSPMPSYSAPSYTSDIMRHLNTLETEEDIENFKQWVEDNFTKYDFFKDSEGKVNHLWLRNILDFIENNRNKDTGKYNIGEIKEYAKNFNFTEVLGVGGSSKEKNGIGKVNNDTLLSGLVAAAFNSKYLGNTENSFGYFRNPLYSDKDILILFQVPMFTKEDYQDKVIDQLYKVWEAENKRSLFYAERQNNKNNAIDNLEKAGKKFHFFPEFNTDNFLEDLAIKESNGENIEEFIKQQLRILLNDYFENFYNQLDDTTIDKAVRINEGKNTSKEVTSLFEDDSQEEKTEEEKEEEKKKLTQEEQERRKNLLRQFYYNDFMNYIESIRLFQGDPALYGNSTALIKRGAQSNVFGQRGYFIDENGNPITERCIYIEDYYADSNNMASIMELLRQDAEVFSGLEKGMIEGLIRKTAHYYEGICTTDGQSFRTIKSIKKILKGFGKLTKEIETSLDNIEKGTMTSLDITNVINSLKPFLYSSEARTLTNDDNINRTEKVVTQHKNSEYALSALYSILNSVLNKSNALKGLQRFMEQYDIDVVHFKSVVKVGANNLFDLNNVYNPSLIEIINTRDNFSLKGRQIIFKLPIILSNKKETTEIPLDINTYNIIQEAVQNGKVSIIGKILNDILRVNVDKDSTLNKNQLYRKQEIYNAFQKQYKLESLSEQEVYDSLDVQYRMDENGNYSPNIPNANKIHTFKLQDYVIVQPVDDHYLDHEAIFGSQLRNIVPANLPDNFTCTLKIKGKEIQLNKEQTIQLYNTLITDQLIDSYNLNLHKKFSLIREFKKYIDDLISSNDKYGEDIYHALQLDESGTDFRVPFTSPNLSNKIDEIILSAAKNAIQRQKIKGGNIVLVSNFGFTSDLHVETETVEVTDEGGNITKQKRIKYIPCYAPMSMMQIYKDYLQEEDDGKGNIWYTIDFEKLKKNNISPKFLDMIGYRIPSENNYSIMPIRIMGILPQSMGSSIILPQDIISMSGTDFKQYWSL